jgi:hypothetical protein
MRIADSQGRLPLKLQAEVLPLSVTAWSTASLIFSATTRAVATFSVQIRLVRAFQAPRVLVDLPRPLETNDGSNRLPVMHQIKRVVDFLEAHPVGNEGCQLDLSLHRILDHAG